MNALIKSIDAEYRRYRSLAEAAIEQVPEEMLSEAGPGNGNSLAIICWHVSGNLKSRFTDFLDSDGEKPWRERDEEFAERSVSRAELINKWNEGWDVLFATLASLQDEDLNRSVTIRGQSLLVHEALHRSLAHVSYHVGQIVYIAHAFLGPEWRYLSIPPGGTAAYNANPVMDKPKAHADGVRASLSRDTSQPST
jgi:hypothetical protein